MKGKTVLNIVTFLAGLIAVFVFFSGELESSRLNPLSRIGIPAFVFGVQVVMAIISGRGYSARIGLLAAVAYLIFWGRELPDQAVKTLFSSFSEGLWMASLAIALDNMLFVLGTLGHANSSPAVASPQAETVN